MDINNITISRLDVKSQPLKNKNERKELKLDALNLEPLALKTSSSPAHAHLPFYHPHGHHFSRVLVGIICIYGLIGLVFPPQE